MSKKLLPCPFCGGEAEIERMGTRRQSCQVACTNCGARHEGPDEDEHSGESWNERATLDGEWQSERPEAGSWWCALALDQRTPTQSVLAVDVDSLDGVWTAADEDWLGKIIEPQFTGALWQRRTVPGDPFKKEVKHE